MFKCYFLGREDLSPELSNYSDFFLKYQPSDWRDSGDGVFSFVSDSGETSALSVLESEVLGISVRYNVRMQGVKRGSEFYSVANREKLIK